MNANTLKELTGMTRDELLELGKELAAKAEQDPEIRVKALETAEATLKELINKSEGGMKLHGLALILQMMLVGAVSLGVHNFNKQMEKQGDQGFNTQREKEKQYYKNGTKVH